MALPVLERRSLGTERLDSAVLYDVFFESATMLGGCLQALMDKAEREHDSRSFDAWSREAQLLNMSRSSVSASDKERQIGLKREWDARRKQLSALL